jgi:N-acetylglucosamine kinase-like BadF-type ATPase
MRTKFILGVDSGATKTICAIVNDKGEALGLGLAGPSSHYAVSVERAKENLLGAIRKAATSAELNNVVFDVGCFGMAALDTKRDYELIRNFVKSLNRTKKNVIVSDAVIAYYAVTTGEPGIVVIAGTGSIAYGVNRSGDEARSGGWEWLISDEGSAFDIARRGLIAALRAYDGKGKNTLLIEMFSTHFSVSTFEEVIQKIYENTEKQRIASLAPIITLAAQKGDLTALKILGEAGKELGLSAVAVAKKLNMERERIIVGCVGGVFRSGKFVCKSFERTVKDCIPQAIFKPPMNDSIRGAIVLGLKESGVPMTRELVSKIEQGLKLKHRSSRNASSPSVAQKHI